MKFYKHNQVPLAVMVNILNDDIVYDEEGNIHKAEEGHLRFKHKSPLRDGEKMSELTIKQQKLFFNIANYYLNPEGRNSDYKRRSEN